MPRHCNNLNTCPFRTFRGLCGKKCFGERCSLHRERRVLTVCNLCGIEENVTNSKTGICGSKVTGCYYKRETVLRRKRRIKEKARVAHLESAVAASAEWLKAVNQLVAARGLSTGK